MSTNALPGRARSARTKHLQLFLDNTAGMIFILSGECVIRYQSPSCRRVLGDAETDRTGQTLLSLVHPDDAAAVQDMCTQALQQPGSNHFIRCRVRHQQDAWCCLDVTATGFADEGGNTSVILRCSETAQLHVEEETPIGSQNHVSSQNHKGHTEAYDALLCYPNRSFFVDVLQQEVRATAHTNRPFALLLMDLDHFRDINATFGPRWGDRILQQVGRRLRHVLREADCIVRLGGDEFGILLSAIGNTDRVVRIVHRILKVLETPFFIDNHPVHVGSSMGIALYPEHASDVDSLLRRADIALYQAKQTGLGYAIYMAAHNQYKPERLALAAEFRQALEHNQLALYFQPKICMADGRVPRSRGPGTLAASRARAPRPGSVYPAG